MILAQHLVVIAGLGTFIAMFDQQPIVALTVARAIVLETHQHPAALQFFSGENEFEFAVAKCLLGIFVTERRPEAAIPQHHRAAAVLAFGNGAFEIAVVEGMVFDFDRQPLVIGIDRRTLGNRPGLEHAVQFEPQIVMQPRRVMFLNDEAKMLCRAARELTRSARRSL